MTAGSRQSFFALFHRDLRGTAAVEFALIAPVLFLLILGITQFGITLNDYEMLTGGTEAAARQFSMSRGSSTPSSSTTTALCNAASNLTQASITFTLKVNGTCVHRRQCVPDRADQRGQGQPRHDNDVHIHAT